MFRGCKPKQNHLVVPMATGMIPDTNVVKLRQVFLLYVPYDFVEQHVAFPELKFVDGSNTYKQIAPNGARDDL